MMPESFKSTEFFQTAKRHLVDAKFTIVGEYSISTDDIPYHVECTAARNSTIVVHKPGVQFLLVLNYHENCALFNSKQWNSSYWNGEFVLNFKSYSDILKAMPEQERKAYLDKYADWHGWTEYRSHLGPPIPMYRGGDIQLSGFRDHGGSSYQDLVTRRFEPADSRVEVSVKDMVTGLSEIRDRIMPYLRLGKFSELNSYHFYPYYSFVDGGANRTQYHTYSSKNAESLWSSRFDMTYLRRAVCNKISFSRL